LCAGLSFSLLFDFLDNESLAAACSNFFGDVIEFSAGFSFSLLSDFLGEESLAATCKEGAMEFSWPWVSFSVSSFC